MWHDRVPAPRDHLLCRPRSETARRYPLTGYILNEVRTSAPGLLPIFRSEIQLAILATLYVGPDRRWTITALAADLDQPTSTTAREINRLADAAIVTITAEGRNKLVGPNWQLPWARSLARLLDQTVGPLALLSETLSRLDGVAEAFIFGSWAARYHGEIGPAPRDIDVLVVGDRISRFDIVDATSSVSDRVGVEVNPYVVNVDEWQNPDTDSFLASVKTKPLVKIPLDTPAHA
jgi:predicted nucleotidyltransferase